MTLFCENCGTSYERAKGSRRRCCSRSCAISLAWKDPEARARREASIKAACNTPENRKRITGQNYRIWDRDDGRRERLAQLSRERWSDPVYKRKVSKTIREV